jgi:hypothetical protein
MIMGAGGFLFDTVWGKAAALAAGLLVLFSTWLWRHDVRVAERATTEFRVSVEKAKEKVRAKAVKARKPAALPGAADRLRQSACRDC